MLGTVAAPKTSKPKRPRAEHADERSKSLLTEIGEHAMRAALLKSLKDNDWNLTRTAESLRMSAASSVIRALKSLAPDEYERARERGDIAMGRPKSS